ncbi:unnamed protein product [Symbiodinium natans]|uniref:Uncharacterized protein n=1 Tax=Symbiodinium natans TaxID=878477 RepID=A0A812MPD6_9DINO|nr:unnamed protein product [Symbiodinium natans]
MPSLYHASASQNRSSIESSGLRPNPGRLGNHVYATFTEGQARKIADHYEQRTGRPQDVWRFDVPTSGLQKVEEHPSWAGMSSFKEVCVDHVPAHQLRRVSGSSSGGGLKCPQCHVNPAEDGEACFQCYIKRAVEVMIARNSNR